MSASPYALAFTSDKPDWAFPTLRRLAVAIVGIRDATADLPEISCVRGQLERSYLPGGTIVVVRLRDGQAGGRGSLMGYAMMPVDPRQREAHVLMAAILAVTAEAPLVKAAAA